MGLGINIKQSYALYFIISFHLTTIQATTMIEKICPFCEEVFNEELIKDHIGIEHLGLETGAFQSTKVSKSNNETEEATFDCKDCTEKFSSESDLKIHQNIVHPNFKFNCGKCDKRFISEHSFKLHQKVVHSSQFEKQGLSKTKTISVKQELCDQSPNRYNSKGYFKSNENVNFYYRSFSFVFLNYCL